MQLNFKRQAGATLIEVIMVVALMAIITIGALTYYNSASEASNVNETVSNLTALTSTIRNTFASQGNYAGLDEPLLAGMQALPGSMKSEVGRTGAGVNTVHTNLRHAWSQEAGAVLVAPVAANNSRTFTITLAELPKGACQDIALKTIGRFESIQGSVAITNAATAITGCANATTNSLVFTSK